MRYGSYINRLVLRVMSVILMTLPIYILTVTGAWVFMLLATLASFCLMGSFLLGYHLWKETRE